MRYKDDTKWLACKNKYKNTNHENDWLYIITLYNMLEGRHVALFCTPKDKPNTSYRIIGVTNDKLDGEVMLRDSKGAYSFYPIDKIEPLVKDFAFYPEELKSKVEVNICPKTVLNDYNVTFYE